jgi:MoaA/NifB/PqqE/SkfB family radical SAM enzyme
MSPPTTAEAGYPKAIYIELTDRCNLTCAMCRCAAVKGEVLPLEVFREVAEQLLPHAVFVDLRGWGESTLLHNFDSYLDIAQEYEVSIKLISNGTTNRPGLWERLGREGVLVGFSIDANEPELFSQLRGGADLGRILVNISTFIDACRSAKLDPKEQGYFCITASLHNLAALPGIVRMGLDLGLNRFKLEPLWAPEGDLGLLHRAPDRVIDAVDELRVLAAETGAVIEYSASLLEQLTVRTAAQKVCIHPWDYCYIDSRGRVGFCDHLNGRPEYAWGRWGEEPFLSFWNGDQMRHLRREHLARLSGEQIQSCADCNWCYDRRYMDLEDLVDSEWADFRVKA